MRLITKKRHFSIIVVTCLVAFGKAATAQQASVNRKDGPVKVFVLAGQSNMEGHGDIEDRPGKKGTLTWLAKNPATAHRYKHLLDKNGKWIVRDDVLLSYYDTKGPLTIGKSAAKNSIGPELAFGWTVGDFFENKVLLIKFAPGGTSLAGPWRPPSSGKAPSKNGELERSPGVGDEYDGMIAGVKKQIENLKQDFPEVGDRGYDLVGFGWHQGWQDGCGEADSLAYEKNLGNFIRDVRKDLGMPKLPFVIGASGFGGWEQTVQRRIRIVEAQMAVANAEEFKDTVRYVETRGFWRPKEESPSKFGYHWNQNAETHYLIGEGMGKAMVELLGGPKAPPNEAKPENTLKLVPPPSKPAL